MCQIKEGSVACISIDHWTDANNRSFLGVIATQPSGRRYLIDLRDVSLREQIHQIPDRPSGVISEPESPPHHDDNDSDIDDDEVDILIPTAILDTWGRGRHMRYKVRWSDGTVTLNPTREVERLAMPLLEAYRRELRRIATAKTREKQKRGDIPKIPGR